MGAGFWMGMLEGINEHQQQQQDQAIAQNKEQKALLMQQLSMLAQSGVQEALPTIMETARIAAALDPYDIKGFQKKAEKITLPLNFISHRKVQPPQNFPEQTVQIPTMATSPQGNPMEGGLKPVTLAAVNRPPAYVDVPEGYQRSIFPNATDETYAKLISAYEELPLWRQKYEEQKRIDAEYRNKQLNKSKATGKQIMDRYSVAGLNPDELYDYQTERETGQLVGWPTPAKADAASKRSNVKPIEIIDQSVPGGHIRAFEDVDPKSPTYLKILDQEGNVIPNAQKYYTPSAMVGSNLTREQLKYLLETNSVRSADLMDNVPKGQLGEALDIARANNIISLSQASKDKVLQYQNMGPVVRDIDVLSRQINTREGAAAAVMGYWKMIAAKANLDEPTRNYLSLLEGATVLIARSLGHTGVLTEQDELRTRKLFPLPTDSENVRNAKMNRINRIIAGIKEGNEQILMRPSVVLTPEQQAQANQEYNQKLAQLEKEIQAESQGLSAAVPPATVPDDYTPPASSGLSDEEYNRILEQALKPKGGQ